MALRRIFACNSFPARLYSTQGVSAIQGVTPIVDDASLARDKLYSKLEIELRGIDPAVLKSYSWFATTAADHLGINIGQWWVVIFAVVHLINDFFYNSSWAERKAHHDRMTLLKSVFIYKKHRVQYEVRTHFRHMHFHKLTQSTLETFLEYIERNLPEGVALKATKVEIQPLPDYLKEAPSSE